MNPGTSLFEILASQARQRPGFSLLLGFLLYALSQLILVPALLWGGGASFGLSLAEVQGLLGGDLSVHPAAPHVFRLLQAGHQVLSWGVTALLLAYLLGRPAEVLHLDASPRPSLMLLASLIMVAAIPAVLALTLDPAGIRLPGGLTGLGEALRQQELRSRSLLEQILQGSHPLTLTANLLVFAALPAVMEELFFRGVVQRELMRLRRPHAAIWLTGLLFSLLHLQVTGFVARLLLGVLLGYFLYYTGSLWVPILAHAVFNAVNILALSGGQDTAAPQSWPILAGTLVAGALLLFWFRRLTPEPLYSLPSAPTYEE